MLALGLAMPPTPHQISAGLARGLAVALLAGVVFTIDTPLKGDTALRPAAIERTLTVSGRAADPLRPSPQPGCAVPASSLYIAPDRPECSSAW